MAFRPQLRMIGSFLRSLGTQLVFLTATMPPRDEAEFFGTLGLERDRVYIVRQDMTRPNIAYAVHGVSGSGSVAALEDQAGIQLASDAAAAPPSGLPGSQVTGAYTQGHRLLLTGQPCREGCPPARLLCLVQPCWGQRGETAGRTTVACERRA